MAAHCGLEGEDSIEVSLQCGQMNYSCDPRGRSEDVEGVWQMERTDTWYANFASSRLVNDFDGQEVRVPDHRVILELCACDRIVVRMKVNWLPFRVSNETVWEAFDRFGDTKSTTKVLARE